MVDREIDLLSRMRDPSRKNGRKFPDPPQVVLEASGGGDVRTETKFTSPLAQALDMPAIGGFMRTVEMANEAAIAKAQAISAKAATGGNTGGTLSGTPEGGMPMLPGQSSPGGRAFGQPG